MQIVLTFNRVVNNKVSILLFRMYIKCHAKCYYLFTPCRITAMCGDYYIGGREFDTLSDLIGYYTSWSDLLKGERLQHPVPPPEVGCSIFIMFVL